eukprot:TRINITY_DN3248_c0_g1_i1.p1 TRINITY_DN3248_c0_g1~~TRINITY_DN3248_c0_g1_i1.p1  ORF type:complete len:814 (+),score=182.60 TRINITY_DN3248_c0_g1_i1:152-2443(+)
MGMLGYPTHWGQLECLKLIVATSYIDKRIGYLALNLLLDEHTEVLMLATQTIKTDIMSSNEFIAGLALVTLGNIASEQICRDTAPELEMLLNVKERRTSPQLLKKAVLCALRVVQKVPDLGETFIPHLKRLLAEREHSVLLVTLPLIRELAKEDLDTIRQKLTKPMVTILRNLISGGFNPDNDIGSVSDPFLQVQLLKTLRVVGEGHQAASDTMNDVLMQILSNTDASRNVGHAVLYECVSTVLSVESEQDLKRMAINILGKFLSNRDNNVRYVGLTTLSRVVDIDVAAVQRHRGVIVERLRDSDLSIRKRALYLIYALVDESNARTLVRELLSFLALTDLTLRANLTAKLCIVAEKFAPSSRWYIDTVLRVMTIAGDFVPDSVRASMVATIIQDPELQSYVVLKTYQDLKESPSQQALVQVGVWSIGEWGDQLTTDGSVTPDQIVDLLEQLYKNPDTGLASREYIVNAYFKLTTRLPVSVLPRLKQNLELATHSQSTEIQQRGLEYNQYLASADPSFVKQKILVPMPAASGSVASFDGGSVPPSPSPSPAPVAPAVVAAPPPVNLLGDLLGSSTPAPTTVSPAPVTTAASDLLSLVSTPSPTPSNGPSSQTQNILNLFGTGPSAPVTTPPLVAPVATPVAPGNGIPSIVAFQNNEISISFSFAKPNPATPRFTLITASITNISASPISALVFLAAPPRHAKYVLDNISNPNINPQQTSTLMVKAANASFGEKSLLMKLRITYSINGANRLVEDVVRNFPPGV